MARVPVRVLGMRQARRRRAAREGLLIGKNEARLTHGLQSTRKETKAYCHRSQIQVCARSSPPIGHGGTRLIQTTSLHAGNRRYAHPSWAFLPERHSGGTTNGMATNGMAPA
jgi:hypothetical protein